MKHQDKFAGCLMAVIVLTSMIPAIAHANSNQETRVKELTVSELAQYAGTGYALYGLTPFTARVVYRGLEMDFENIDLLQAAADLLVEGQAAFSACVYEYMFGIRNKMTSKQKRYFDASYASAMWIWGLSKRKDGSKDTPMASFYDTSLFEFDTRGYKALIAGPVGASGNLGVAVKGVQRLLGLFGGLVQPKDPKHKLLAEDLFKDDQFVVTAEYAKWLESSLDEFKELDRRVSEINKNK